MRGDADPLHDDGAGGAFAEAPRAHTAAERARPVAVVMLLVVSLLAIAQVAVLYSLTDDQLWNGAMPGMIPAFQDTVEKQTGSRPSEAEAREALEGESARSLKAEGLAEMRRAMQEPLMVKGASVLLFLALAAGLFFGNGDVRTKAARSAAVIQGFGVFYSLKDVAEFGAIFGTVVFALDILWIIALIVGAIACLAVGLAPLEGKRAAPRAPRKRARSGDRRRPRRRPKRDADPEDDERDEGE